MSLDQPDKTVMEVFYENYKRFCEENRHSFMENKRKKDMTQKPMMQKVDYTTMSVTSTSSQMYTMNDIQVGDVYKYYYDNDLTAPNSCYYKIIKIIDKQTVVADVYNDDNLIYSQIKYNKDCFTVPLCKLFERSSNKLISNKDPENNTEGYLKIKNIKCLCCGTDNIPRGFMNVSFLSKNINETAYFCESCSVRAWTLLREMKQEPKNQTPKSSETYSSWDPMDDSFAEDA
jgi:hypothetical protein